LIMLSIGPSIRPCSSKVISVMVIGNHVLIKLDQDLFIGTTVTYYGFLLVNSLTILSNRSFILRGVFINICLDDSSTKFGRGSKYIYETAPRIYFLILAELSGYYIWTTVDPKSSFQSQKTP
jgi:hypothetical protein